MKMIYKIMKRERKGMIAIDELLKWILGLVVLAIIVISILIFSGKGGAAIEYMKQLFRFGR